MKKWWWYLALLILRQNRFKNCLTETTGHSCWLPRFVDSLLCSTDQPQVSVSTITYLLSVFRGVATSSLRVATVLISVFPRALHTVGVSKLLS